MPTYSITDPSGKVYSIDGPEGATQEQVIAQIQAAQKSAPVGDPSGPQPSAMDRFNAGPTGRFVHDAIIQPASGLASTVARNLPFIGGTPVGNALGDMVQKGANTLFGEQGYQDALARTRNAPGYAAARTQADQGQGAHPSGFTDQMMAPVLPALAGLTGLMGGSDSANANADAQAEGQQAYAKAHPVLSTVAGVGGGLLAGPEAGLPKVGAAVPALKAPAIADLRAAAKQAYQKVDNSGVRVSTDSLNGMADSLQDKMVDRLDPTLHPEATAAYNRVMRYATDQPEAAAPATFTQLDNLRRVVADAGGSIKPADRALARQILDHVDDYVGGLTSTDLDTSALDQARASLTSATGQKGAAASQIKSIEMNKPGALAARGAAGADARATYMGLRDQLPQLEAGRQSALSDFNAENSQIQAGPQSTIDALKSARDLWSRSSKAQTLQNIIDKAKNNSTGFAQSGYENALRSGFRKLLNNDRGIARFSPAERDAIKQVATGGSAGSATNLLRQVGKLHPQGAIPLLSEGAMVLAAGPSALAVPAAGIVGRTGATLLQSAAAKRAVNLAARGPSAAIPLNPAFQLPRLTSRSAIPLGLLGPASMASVPRR